MLKNLFQLIVKTSDILKGVKVQLSGKIQGKTRATHQNIIIGNISTQTLKNIVFEKTHIYTNYGAFGLKIWVYKLI
jgi:ribosomal protein S3